MKQLVSILLVAALALGLMLMGCGSSDSGGSGPAITIFTNTTYVDYDPTASTAEASVTKGILQLMGYSPSTFNGISADDIDTAASANSYMFIPSQTKLDIITDLDTAARASIANFVNDGGKLVVFGDTSARATDFVNAIFGYSIELYDGKDYRSAMFIAGENAETVFSVKNTYLPASIESIYNIGWDSSTLPTGGYAIYERNDTIDYGTAFVAHVAQINYGNGSIFYFSADPSYLDKDYAKVLGRVLGGAADGVKEVKISVENNNLQLDLFSPDGKILINTSTYSTDMIGVGRGVAAQVMISPAGYTGPYTIKTGWDCIMYSVCLSADEVEATNPDSYEPNDTAATATSIGENWSQNHYIDTGEVDWVKTKASW